MCGWFDLDDGLTLEERQEQEDEYNRLHPYLRYARRRGVTPGEFGYKPIIVLVSCLFFMVGVLWFINSLTHLSDPSNYFFLALSPLIIVFAVLFPIYAFRADDRVRARSAAREYQREQEIAAQEDPRRGREPRVRSVEDAEEDDDKVWIPGRTHEPRGSEPTEEEEEAVEEILGEQSQIRPEPIKEDGEGTQELLE